MFLLWTLGSTCGFFFDPDTTLLPIGGIRTQQVRYLLGAGYGLGSGYIVAIDMVPRPLKNLREIFLPLGMEVMGRGMLI